MVRCTARDINSHSDANAAATTICTVLRIRSVKGFDEVVERLDNKTVSFASVTAGLGSVVGNALAAESIPTTSAAVVGFLNDDSVFFC